jgi:hypothetical protein
MPLEGQWWTPDMATFSTDEKVQWNWTMMIVLPAQATAQVVDDARVAAERKHPQAPLDRVRLERFAEGRCAQVLHVGPYSEEARPSRRCTRSSPRTIARSPAGTTRSTWATRAGRRPAGCGRSCGSRSRPPAGRPRRTVPAIDRSATADFGAVSDTRRKPSEGPPRVPS